ncbi:hypothetical protein NC652_013976 [Populus alba x Populus x berolinensis]|nr:hypothetical protein NC652_013976 [Populus alba x Populus x berolinensis]
MIMAKNIIPCRAILGNVEKGLNSIIFLVDNFILAAKLTKNIFLSVAGDISATFRKAYQNDRATSDVISQDYHSSSDERLSNHEKGKDGLFYFACLCFIIALVTRFLFLQS